MIKLLRSVLLCALTLTAFACYAQQPVINYASPQTYNVGIAIDQLGPTNSGGAMPMRRTLRSGGNLLAVSVDAADNAYYISGNLAVKIPAGTAGTVRLGTTYNAPTGITADGAGNIYVADFGNHAIKKVSPDGTTIVTYSTAITSPYGIVSDVAGNLFVSDRATNTVKKIPAGGGVPVILASGLNIPSGVTLDSDGNVYVCDKGNNAIKKIDSGGNVTVVGTGNGNLSGVAVDAAGNIYFADANNTSIVEIPKAGGAPFNISSGFLTPMGVAINSAGYIYIADTGNSVLIQTQVAGYNISPALPAGLTIDAGSGIISGTPSGASPATNYTVIARNPSGSGSATVNITVVYPALPNISYNTPQVYTVASAITAISPANSGGPVSSGGYSITPALPIGLAFDNATGTISGKPAVSQAAKNFTITAVNASGSNSTVLNITVNAPQQPNISYNSSYVFTTTVPVTPFGPSNTGGPVAVQAPVTFASNVYGVSGLASDAAGNIYVLDAGKSSVQKIAPKGGTPTILGSGISFPLGISLDGANNIFVQQLLQSALKKISAVNGSTTLFSTVSGTPARIASDQAGNVYVTDPTHNKIFKISTGGSQTTLPIVGTTAPSAIAVDAAGNIYVGDNGDHTVKKIAANSVTAVTIATGFNVPEGVFVDAAGNVYVADLNLGNIKRIPAAGGAPVIVATFDAPIGVVADALGALYISDNTSTLKYIGPGGYNITPDLPAGLTFDHSTGVITGVPSAPSPATNYTITAYNAGGSNSVTVNIKVDHYPFPQVTYSPAVFSLNVPVNPPATPASTNVSPLGDYIKAPFATGSNTIPGIALDASGNAYLSLSSTKTVVMVPAGSGQAITLASGFNPAGIAVDKLNNVYVVDALNNLIKKIPANGGAAVTLVSGLNQPYGLAIDASDNLYVTNLGSGLVQKIPSGSSTPVTVGPQFTQPRGITIDAAGNIYIADATDGIKKIPAGNTSTAIPLASSANQPYGVAVDVAGNVFFVEKTGTSIKELPAGGGPVTTVTSGLGSVISIAVDNKSVFYVGDAGSFKTITPAGGYFLNKALPAGLVLDNSTGAISGTPTAVSPATDYPITAYNVGGSSNTTANIQVVFNAGLSNLVLTPGTLNQAFSSNVTSYSAVAPNAVSSVKVTPTAIETGAAITVNGTPVASGAASASLPLAAGSNTITTVVTSPDGVSNKTYTLTVTRAAAGLSTNAVLSSIKITPATGLTVVSGPGYVNYTTSVPSSEASMTITAIHQDANSTIKINGVAVTSGTASPAIPLNVGSNVINIVVTAQDGATTKTYIITATKTASALATLSNLTISAGTLSPVFASATTGYTAIVPNATTSVKLTPTVTDANATIKVNGITVASGAATSNIPLVVGANAITTVVTAQDGTTTKTYTVTVTRAAAGLSTNALLSSIKITPATGLTLVSGPGYANYTTTIPAGQTSLTVTAIHQDANSTIKINGTAVTSGIASPAIPLSVGNTVINIVVTAQDGATTKTYIITATKAASATLANLALSAGTLNPVFATATTSYTAAVPNATPSLKLTPTSTDPSATIKVNGVTVASGAASANIMLAVGSNVINTVITAQDGTTTKTYTVTVTRSAAGLSTNALLTSIRIAPNTGLTVVSGPGYANYTTSVQNSETSLTVTATHQEANSTIKINGTAVASGVASPAIPLSVGSNTINIVVTAQDGATTKTYIITATRAASGMAMKYEDPAAAPILSAGVTVHQGVSPNGDGDNDVLTIEGITNYPDNNLQIMSRSGELVYQVKGYDNRNKVFDGQSNINGKLQPAGTYFYSLDYKEGNETKRKTGFIVLKY